ncbi:MAG: hypothetical protein IPJ84_08060 [Bdellovibrionales bacterium]|nr:hypothetical protein [Bdellovibrionales bacterium]
MNLLNLIVMASIAAVVLVSFDASASCTATVTCKNEDTATCTHTGGIGGNARAAISICGITTTNKSRFCQTSRVNERGEVYSERVELICCDKDGNAVSILSTGAEAVSAQVCASI